MTTLYVRDARTGQLVGIDTSSPSGNLYVLDADTGNYILLDLSNPVGVVTAIDADTGNFVDINYSNPTGILTVIDPNTGNFVDIDLSSPTGSLYSLDENTGRFSLVDLSTAGFVSIGKIGGIALDGGDTTAPTAPTGLTATPVSASQIDLAWTDASSDEAGFRVYRSTDGGSYSQLGTDLSAGTQVYSDTTPTGGTTYYYKIGVFDAAGNEALSSAASTNTLLFGLQSYWTLDESSGTRNDSKATNHLSDNNTVTGNPGKVSTASQFTAANSEYLTGSADGVLRGGDFSMTISVWVYFDSEPSEMGICSSEYPGWILRYISDRFQLFWNDTKITSADNFGAISTGTWYHILAWADKAGNQTGISVNGTADTNTYSAGNQGSTTFYIGRRNTSTYLDGRIDELAAYNRILSAAEKTALYNGGAGFRPPF